ncbi:uncharacterized protein LOC108033127 isoform X2 [Drosophila biarmipes]|uniref:uncharacterized protein LOC108033127 isoform X2 n=1 Tax=Drosophila biarmipes TaxID=125945 RepID=UPI001CDA83B7|nr:uncharacterized protein LOC108033127 isoform X2 [Drosophila biarmipes]
MNKTRPYLPKGSTDSQPNAGYKVEKLLAQFAQETEMMEGENQPPENEPSGNESQEYDAVENESIGNENRWSEPPWNKYPWKKSARNEHPWNEFPGNEPVEDESPENEPLENDFGGNENTPFGNEPLRHGRGREYIPFKDDEALFTLSHLTKPIDILLEYIQTNEFADIIITIDDHSFVCHSVILCIYSQLLLTKILELPIGEDQIVFDDVELTPKGFSDTYAWMISSDGTPNVDNLLEMLRTAYFLKITELLEICWKILDKHLYDEFSAFNVLYELRGATELEELFESMAGRVSRSTMAVLASREFMCLAEVQVCCLLKSSGLSVNSEIEKLDISYIFCIAF